MAETTDGSASFPEIRYQVAGVGGRSGNVTRPGLGRLGHRGDPPGSAWPGAAVTPGREQSGGRSTDATWSRGGVSQSPEGCWRCGQIGVVGGCHSALKMSAETKGLRKAALPVSMLRPGMKPRLLAQLKDRRTRTWLPLFLVMGTLPPAQGNTPIRGSFRRVKSELIAVNRERAHPAI